jgi:hypothetical protein
MAESKDDFLALIRKTYKPSKSHCPDCGRQLTTAVCSDGTEFDLACECFEPPSFSQQDLAKCVTEPAAAMGDRPGSLSDVEAYALSLGKPIEAARRFWDFNERNKWTIRGEPMRDWRSAMRRWS